jgi:hypothetical protein
MKFFFSFTEIALTSLKESKHGIKKISALWNVTPCRLPVRFCQTTRRHITEDF